MPDLESGCLRGIEFPKLSQATQTAPCHSQKPLARSPQRVAINRHHLQTELVNRDSIPGRSAAEIDGGSFTGPPEAAARESRSGCQYFFRNQPSPIQLDECPDSAPKASTRRIVCQQDCWKRTSLTCTPLRLAGCSRSVAESRKWSADCEVIGKRPGLARPPGPFLRPVFLFLTCAELKAILCYAPGFRARSEPSPAVRIRPLSSC